MEINDQDSLQTDTEFVVKVNAF